MILAKNIFGHIMIDSSHIVCIHCCNRIEQTGQKVGFDVTDSAGCSFQTGQYIFHMILPDRQKAGSDKGIGIVCPCDA